MDYFQDDNLALREEIEQLEIEVGERRIVYADLDADIKTQIRELSVFKGLYYSKVGKHIVDKKRLDLSIRRNLYITICMLESDYSFDFDELNKEFEKIYADEIKQVDEYSLEGESDYEMFLMIKSNDLQEDPEYLNKCKELYTKLARYFHPDLHHLDPRIDEFTKIMASINECYRNRDLKCLQRIDDGVEFSLEITGESPLQKLDRLKKTKDRIDECIDLLLDKLNSIKNTDIFALMNKWQSEGDTFIEELAFSAAEKLRKQKMDYDASVSSIISNLKSIMKLLLTD